MKRSLASLLVLLLCASCGTSSPDTKDDQGIGSDIDTPDPVTGPDPCVDLDQCDPPASGTGGADPGTGGGGGAGGGDPAPTPPEGYVAGARLYVKTYATLRKAPAASADPVTGVAPEGGVHDALHLWNNPAGMIPPAQVVELVDPQKSGGFFKVKYDGKTGWVAAAKLVLSDEGADPIAFALQPAHRNMFFKHQIHRTLWNKDGPSSSGNCAPTSLAMAARILGKEPPGLSVEESIHRVREAYDPGLDEHAGTSRADLYAAATSKKIGLSAHEMSTDHPDLGEALAALDAQLDKRHLVALEGYPSASGAYKKGMDEAYAAARAAGESLYHATYEVYVRHSILVLGRDGKGRYVVGDPMSEVGFVALSAAAMKDYMARWVGHRGTGVAVWAAK